MSTETDVVIIGAGPVGVFQIFELGLQGLKAHLIDALPEVGGQCIELYPDKPIYDIPAVPVCTGKELIDKLLEQVAPFEATMHLDQTVDDVKKDADGLFTVTTSKGTAVKCKAVIIAAGAGSFTPVKLRVEGIDAFENAQLFYRVRDPKVHAGKNLVVLGGGDSAIDWALALADSAASVTVINRTERFRAAEASVDKLMSLQDEGKVKVIYGSTKSFTESDGKLVSITCELRDEQKTMQEIPVDDLLVFFGLSPKLGPIENWGMALEKNLVTVNVETFETTVPGIYSVGDINTYPGKKKLILSGFHETALCAAAIKHQFEPDKKQFTQYTTTSTLLQKRLGVEADKA